MLRNLKVSTIHSQQAVIVVIILVPVFKFNLQSSSWNEYGACNNIEKKSKLTMKGSKLAKPSMIGQMYLRSVMGSIEPLHPPTVAHADSSVGYTFIKKGPRADE